MKLYIVRHGQTGYNIDNKVCGISDVELTSLGKQQAKMASEQLKDISFLPGDDYSYTPKDLNHLLDCLEIYFDKKIDREELLISVEQAWNIAYESERPSITVAVKEQRKRYGRDMRDVLSFLIHEL